MKRLYREVAKRVHPDLTSDRADRAKRQQLMAEANEAYERGDETRLRKIFTEYEWSAEAVQGEGPGAELIRVIRRISQARGRLAEIEAELQELLRSDLYQLKVRLDEAQSHGRDVLKEMVQKVEDQIAQAKRRLENRARAGPLTMETRERSAEVQTAQHGGQQIVPAASRGLARAFRCAGGARPAGHGARFQLADQESFSWLPLRGWRFQRLAR